MHARRTHPVHGHHDEHRACVGLRGASTASATELLSVLVTGASGRTGKLLFAYLKEDVRIGEVCA